MNKPNEQPARELAQAAASGERRVKVTAKRLDPPDRERFVAALIAMAMARLEEQKGKHG